MERQRFNKLATIYRLCAVLEVELIDVLPRIKGICDKPSPDMYIGHGEKPSDKSRGELDEFVDDVKEGGKV